MAERAAFCERPVPMWVYVTHVIFGSCLERDLLIIVAEPPMLPFQFSDLPLKRCRQEQLVQLGDLRPSSLVKQFTKCGRSTCQCAEEWPAADDRFV